MNWDKIKQYGLLAVIGLLLIVVIWGAIGKWSNDKEMARLRNEVALRDKTIEVQKGVYTKLSLETADLRKLLDSKDEQVKGLLEQVKKNKEDLLAANQVAIKWKKAYEGAVAANQTEVPVDPGNPTGPTRKKVTFQKDWGMIGVSGYTLTDPAEAFVKVEQLRALMLTLAISQDPTGAWHSYVTSNDENTAVDIKLAAVNPHILEPKWYEKLQLNLALAGGTTNNGFGILVGAGVSYKIKQFDVGPAVFLGISSTVSPYFGATFAWRPFEK